MIQTIHGQNKTSAIIPEILAIFSGMMVALSYPRYDFGFLAWVALVPLFFAIHKKSLPRSFCLGLLAGFTMYGISLWWVKTLNPALYLLVSALLALYVGGFCFVYQFVKKAVDLPDYLLLPPLWVAFEFARSFGALAHPVGFLGYSQYRHLTIIQAADILGVTGLSFLIVLVNVLVFSLFRSPSVLRSIKLISAIGVIFSLLFAYGWNKLEKSSVNEKLNFRIAIVQPNIDYYSGHYNAPKSLEVLDQLTARASREKPDLIIWPETVIKEFSLGDQGTVRELNSIVGKYKSYLLYGRPLEKRNGGGKETFNSVFLWTPAGHSSAYYSKIHLVPFGDTFNFFKLVRGEGVYAPGNDLTILKTPKAWFSVAICFDGLFPELVSQFVNKGAQFIVNVADDSWSNSLDEYYQHASMAVFRAVENRIYYVRAANSGLSGVIDPSGRFVKSLPVLKRGYLTTLIGTKREKTFFNQHGDLVGYFSFIITFAVSLFSLGIGLINYYRIKTIS